MQRSALCSLDLGESFPTSICLMKSASIQPRTSPSKFGGKFNSIFTSLLSRAVSRGSERWLRRGGQLQGGMPPATAAPSTSRVPWRVPAAKCHRSEAQHQPDFRQAKPGRPRGAPAIRSSRQNRWGTARIWRAGPKAAKTGRS